jgi:hypothetical protein
MTLLAGNLGLILIDFGGAMTRAAFNTFAGGKGSLRQSWAGFAG